MSSNRSNVVKRRFTVGTTTYDVLDCREGHEFERVGNVQGVRPFYCPEHETKKAPRKAKPVTIPTVANVATPEPIPANPRHYRYSLIRAIVGCGVHVFLVGPAGSGKSSVARHVAEDMELAFYSESGHELMTAYDLLGFKNAMGEFIITYLIQAIEFGGIFLMDEMDAMNAAALVAMNNIAALSPGQTIRVGDREVEVHPDFHLIGGGNTWGRGATAAFNSRQVIDGATLDRFAAIDFGYDLHLEYLSVGVSVPSDIPANPRYKTGTPANDETVTAWVRDVQRYREAVNALPDLEAMVTPRASIMGAKMLRAGIHMDYVLASLVRKGIDNDGWRSVKANLPALAAA